MGKLDKPLTIACAALALICFLIGLLSAASGDWLSVGVFGGLFLWNLLMVRLLFLRRLVESGDEADLNIWQVGPFFIILGLSKRILPFSFVIYLGRFKIIDWLSERV